MLWGLELVQTRASKDVFGDLAISWSRLAVLHTH